MPDVRIVAVKHIAQQVRGDNLRISEALDYLADITSSLEAGTVEITNNIINVPQDVGWIRESTPDRVHTTDPALQVIIGQDLVPAAFRIDLAIIGLDEQQPGITLFGASSVIQSFAPYIAGFKSRGTAQLRTAVATDDIVFQMAAAAWDGDEWRDIGNLRFFVKTFTGDKNMSGCLQCRIQPDGFAAGQVEVWRTYSNGMFIGGVPRVPVGKLDVEDNTNSQAELPVLVLHRMRADSTTPATGFGSQIVWHIEGPTNGVELQAAMDAAGWESVKGSFSSYRRILTMFAGNTQESVRWSSDFHSYQNMSDVTFVYRDAASFKTLSRYVFGNNTPMYDLVYHGRGTFSSPAAVVTGEILWDRETRAYDGVPQARTASLERIYIDNYTGNDNFSAAWVLYLRPTGTTPVLRQMVHCTTAGMLISGVSGADGNPAGKLHLVDNSQLLIQFDTSSSDAGGIVQTVRKSRGTYASPSTVNSGDGVYYLGPWAHDGTAYRQIALISCEVDTRTGTDDLSSRLRFYTRPDGASASIAERFRITKDGDFLTFGGYFEMDERSDPAAPASNKSRLYTRDNGSGKTQLVVRFPTGAIQVIATEP